MTTGTRQSAAKNSDEVGTILVNSIFGYNTKRGLVVLAVDRHQRMMDPGEARRIARMLMEAAEAAEGDEVAWAWLSSLLGEQANDQRTAAMLLDFRKLRGQISQRRRLSLEGPEGEDKRLDLLTRAEVILSALDVSWDMKPIDATNRADAREFLMEQLARCRAGDDPESGAS